MVDKMADNGDRMEHRNEDCMDHDNGDSLYDMGEEDLKNEVPTRMIVDGTHAILSLDALGPGGAHHAYGIEIAPRKFSYINFQEGPIEKGGAPGCTNEDLLAIVKDRLECLQAGPFPCEENVRALKKVQEALDWLDHRTAERVKRGVEGTDNA
ncbi:MAG: hypothetical protein IMF11_03310 [Proteobacteria bacterium]|nr:hypothetical protein [Pseudomonadota bacterium]